jgi:predicted DNA-binding transcriptional regulator AlpA
MANDSASAFDNLPAEGFIRQAQLVPQVVPFSPATLWRKVRDGEFPKPCKLSTRVTAWRVGDVRAWLQQRASETGAGR